MEYSKKTLPGMEEVAEPAAAYNTKAKTSSSKKKEYEPPNLGKAIKLQVPDFSDPNRPKTCLEVDFPIAQVNSLAIPESTSPGVRKRAEYNAMKWFARRSQSVFRSLILAAAIVPDETENAAKLVWEHFYVNHQEAVNFNNFRILDPFMGGGTTLVEGTRLGFEVTGVDLNPIAWLVSKNAITDVDPKELEAYFQYIEEKVDAVIKPFYVTTCPRGHKGGWVSGSTGLSADEDPIYLEPREREGYLWTGPEIIYTFWAKHGPCPAPGCGHRTPILSTPVIAVKTLTTYFVPIVCPSCEHRFHSELGQTRIAPNAQLVVLEDEPSFTELSQSFARLLQDYSKGGSKDKRKRVQKMLSLLKDESGLFCPSCGEFAGQQVKETLTKHGRAKRISDINKRDFGIERYRVNMHLLVHPKWLVGTGETDEDGANLGGYAGAPSNLTTKWFHERLKGLHHIEVRGNMLPATIELEDGTLIETSKGTVPAKSNFTCAACGRQEDILSAVKLTEQTPPVAPYALQCHCPQCQEEGYNYNGRYFKVPDGYDLERLSAAETEWETRSQHELLSFWPKEQLEYSYMTYHLNGGIPNWGYTHWWKMFNSRQLLVHTQLLQTLLTKDAWKQALKEQALGAFQQYLRNQCMFAFWHRANDVPVPHFSNNNYHPKQTTIENNFAGSLGYGNWYSCRNGVLKAVESIHKPWDSYPIEGQSKALKVMPGDKVSAEKASINCTSSTDLGFLDSQSFDLVVTDPPFGNLLYYADLADFFYVWLRIPLNQWYRGQPEQDYFSPTRTPHSMEAIENPAEHPDNREEWEKTPLLKSEHLALVRKLLGDKGVQDNDPNPLYRPEPAGEFYRQTLTTCWAEASRLLKPAGILTFTFHHSEDEPWVDVLESLFNAGLILVATYPIHSDDTKGEGEFGSRKIEYDIIHVCRKRLEVPNAVSWSQMRRWVKKEAQRLKEMLEISHGKDLLEPDMLVILRGKALEFYSRHYGQVYTGDDDLLGVRDALLGINQLLEDVIAGEAENGRHRPPDAAEPATRFYLRLFQKDTEMDRDELHKTMRGTGITSDDFEARGWITVAGTTVKAIPIKERYAYFTTPGRNRKVLKTDLDQAHFLIGAALPGSGLDITQELNRNTLALKKSVDVILEWYAQTATTENIQKAAQLASGLVTHWRAQPQAQPGPQQMSLFQRLEAEE